MYMLDFVGGSAEEDAIVVVGLATYFARSYRHHRHLGG